MLENIPDMKERAINEHSIDARSALALDARMADPAKPTVLSWEHRLPAGPTSLAQLASESKAQLTDLYEHSKPGPMPDGITDGKAIFMPGTDVGKVISDLGNRIWAGKIFDDDHHSLENRILGHKLVKADLSEGPSWLDGKPANIIDYKNTSWLAGFIRDEIREVSPGLYLGIAYARLPGNHRYPATFFALETEQKK